MLDNEGREVPGMRGYKYFGAARDLPGVRELFAKPAQPPSKRRRADLRKNIGVDYYGYRDEEDGALLPAEAEAERGARASLMEQWVRAGAWRRSDRRRPTRAAGSTRPSSVPASGRYAMIRRTSTRSQRRPCVAKLIPTRTSTT